MQYANNTRYDKIYALALALMCRSSKCRKLEASLGFMVKFKHVFRKVMDEKDNFASTTGTDSKFHSNSVSALR